MSKEARPKIVTTTPLAPLDTQAALGGFASASQSPAFLTFILHAHLPYVIHHGMWPHGLEWLLEAAAETYLPLLRMLTRLERDGIALHCNLDLSPILLEQLAHPTFQAEFPNYASRKINAAREDEAFFLQSGDQHLASTARFWQHFYSQALTDFNVLDHNIVSGFRHFNNAGLINIITSAATHGFLPLLGTDESIRAQIQLAVETHTRHLGVAPKGVWLPECGYRPAGHWDFPVGNADGTPAAPGFDRAGIENLLAEANLSYFFVDTQLVDQAASRPDLYRPHPVAPQPETTVFARDPRTALQVWSGDIGYPGDFNYLDFHKKRFPGGHRYWKVTGANVGIDDKQPWYPQDASARIAAHATHFAGLVKDTLQPSLDPAALNPAVPPILSALFDAELFGHWWFEGIEWLEAVARELHTQPGLTLIDCNQYLALYPPTTAPISMSEGSWGAGGHSQVWLNHETSWTYARIYPAQLFVKEIVTAGKWRSCELGTRITKQLCRELLLLESSDWQFLITTGTARDYAESRFSNHYDDFCAIRAMYAHWDKEGSIPDEQELRLADIETRDSIFPHLNPTLWATV